MEILFYNLLTFLGENRSIETLLFGTLEDDCHGTLLMKVLVIVVNFLLGSVLLVGTIGVVWSGLQILTARDNASMVANGKKRIIDILIGISAFVLMYVILDFVVPGGVTLDSEMLSSSESCPVVTELPPATTTPGEPETPGGGGTCGDGGKSIKYGGYCYAKTKVLPYEYVSIACSKYHSCQSHKSSEWGSSCEAFARINSAEMMYGYPETAHESISGGASVKQKVHYYSKDGDDQSPLLCHGSVSRTIDGKASNRKAFKEAVIDLVDQIMSGKPVTIAAGTKNRGSWPKTNEDSVYNRHFITVVGVSDFVNSTNIKNAEIQFEDGNCLNGGNGHVEPYNQPIIKIDGKEVKFRYVDPWGATLGTLGESGNRVWRFHYKDDSWYIFHY